MNKEVGEAEGLERPPRVGGRGSGNNEIAVGGGSDRGGGL
jgi:hypothetical protein